MFKTLTFVAGLMGAAIAQDPTGYPNYCSAESSTREGYTGTVGYTTDGQGFKRCYSVITPVGASEEKPVPIMFWFHGSGGDGSNCGQMKAADDSGRSLAELAGQNGFALVCGEANQYADGGGQWDIPVVQNATTGNQCLANDTGAYEITYL